MMPSTRQKGVAGRVIGKGKCRENNCTALLAARDSPAMLEGKRSESPRSERRTKRHLQDDLEDASTDPMLSYVSSKIARRSSEKKQGCGLDNSKGLSDGEKDVAVSTRQTGPLNHCRNSGPTEQKTGIPLPSLLSHLSISPTFRLPPKFTFSLAAGKFTSTFSSTLSSRQSLKFNQQNSFHSPQNNGPPLSFIGPIQRPRSGSVSHHHHPEAYHRISLLRGARSRLFGVDRVETANKRPASSPHPHLFNRTKKRKNAHRFFRSEKLLHPPPSVDRRYPSHRDIVDNDKEGSKQSASGTNPSLTPIQMAFDSSRLHQTFPDQSKSQYNPRAPRYPPTWWASVSRNSGEAQASRMAPSEEEWVGDGTGWEAQQRLMFKTPACVATSHSSASLPDNDRSLVESARTVKQGDNGQEAKVERFSPISPNNPGTAMIRSTSSQVRTSFRPRSFSSPALLQNSMTTHPAEKREAELGTLGSGHIGTRRETIEPQLPTKQHLMAVLRMRLSEGGNRGGEAGLRFKKWVVWNSWVRRTTTVASDDRDEDLDHLDEMNSDDSDDEDESEHMGPFGIDVRSEETNRNLLRGNWDEFADRDCAKGNEDSVQLEEVSSGFGGGPVSIIPHSEEEGPNVFHQQTSASARDREQPAESVSSNEDGLRETRQRLDALRSSDAVPMTPPLAPSTITTHVALVDVPFVSLVVDTDPLSSSAKVERVQDVKDRPTPAQRPFSNCYAIAPPPPKAESPAKTTRTEKTRPPPRRRALSLPSRKRESDPGFSAESSDTDWDSTAKGPAHKRGIKRQKSPSTSPAMACACEG